MSASFGYILNQSNFGLLPFGYELWVNTTSVCIEFFSGNQRLKVSCVDIERLFKMSALLSEHELGAKFVVLKKKLNVTKIYLGH